MKAPEGAAAGPEQPVRAVLFDVDDTLYRVADLVRHCWVEAREELGRYGICPDALFEVYTRQLACGAYEDVLERTLTVCGHDRSLAALVRRIGQGPVPAHLPVFDGVVSMMTALRRAGRCCGVVTNGEPDRQRAKLRALGVDQLVDVVVCAGGSVPAKPSPEPFLAACQMLGVDPFEVLYVGDRPDFDVAPSVALGMRAIRVVQGNHAGRPSNGLAVLETADVAVAWSAALGLAGLPAAPMPAEHATSRRSPVVVAVS